MARGTVQQVIATLLQTSPVLSTRDVAARAGVSRQAAHKQLRLLVQSGELKVEGRARAARYQRPVDDSALRVVPVDVSALKPTWQPAVELYAAPPPTVDVFAPSPVVDVPLRLGVAEAGTLYRLSARLLLSDVKTQNLVLDFANVSDVSEEYMEELFVHHVQANPDVRFTIVNLPKTVRQKVRDYARARCRLTIRP